jgi:hypothetical protein
MLYGREWTWAWTLARSWKRTRTRKYPKSSTFNKLKVLELLNIFVTFVTEYKLRRNNVQGGGGGIFIPGPETPEIYFLRKKVTENEKIQKVKHGTTISLACYNFRSKNRPIQV